MPEYPQDIISVAKDYLGVTLDKQSIVRALNIQRRTGLSIANGEISVISFKAKPTVFVNFQGYLALAEAHPQYDGFDCETEIIDGEAKAVCRVWRKDRTRPTIMKAWEKEDKKDTPIWREKPRYMLEKVAIVRALRTAFPVLNGTYAPEEFGYEDTSKVVIDVEPVEVEEPISSYSKISNTCKPDPSYPKNSDNCKPVEKKETVFKGYVDAVKRNYTELGYSLDIFDRAELVPGMEWDKAMLDADWDEKQRAKNRAAKELATFAATVTKAEAVKPVKMCVGCGKNPVMTAQELKTLEALYPSGYKFETDLCKECATLEFNVWKAEQPKTPVCERCGKTLTTAELSTVTLFSPDKPLCAKCLKETRK